MPPNRAQVKQFIESEFPKLELKPLPKQPGWSVWQGFVRIVRFRQVNPNRKVEFKPVVSAKKEKNRGLTIELTSDWKNQIRKAIERELSLCGE